MANAVSITNASAIVLCNALVDRFDVSTPGTIVVYDGTAPADVETALSGNTVLATLTFAATAFGNAADATPGAIATANAIVDDTSAVAGNPATFFLCSNTAEVVT